MSLNTLTARTKWLNQTAPKGAQLTKRGNRMTLTDYIDEHYKGNQSEFGRSLPKPVSPQQVTQWITAGFIVINDQLYSKRRDLK